MTIKLLLGGSPCTYWSIAKTNGRETTAEGQGWELFKNYLIAKEKFKPDFFLYENNWSASNAIKEQIQAELGCKLVRINSALVSAQKRDRFYVCNWDVEQPKDRGIVLADILEGEHPADLTGNQRTMIANPVRVGTLQNADGVAKDAQATRIYESSGKSVALKANGGGWGAKTGLYAQEARGVGYRNRRDEEGKLVRRFEGGAKEKANCLTTVQTDSMVAELLNTTKNGKAQCVRASCYKDGIRNLVGNTVDKRTCVAIPRNGGKGDTVYTVADGQIEIKGKLYPIKLKDGHYIIRKLTPVECERLQTLPDNYTACVSNTQRYKGLGNGWTAEVIIHILQGALKDVPKDEKIIVLSMYDGIGTGRYCLDKMGFTNVEYHAFEIDKFAKQVANNNYPDIIQHGDAFQIREWEEKKEENK